MKKSPGAPADYQLSLNSLPGLNGCFKYYIEELAEKVSE